MNAPVRASASQNQGRAVIAGISGFAAAYLLLFAPNELLGLETGLVGSALLLLAGWSAIHGLSTTRSDPESLITLGEKQAWVALITTAVVGAYLFAKLSALGWDAGPDNRGLRKVVANSVAMLIGANILAGLLRRRESGSTLEDERDRAIRRGAASVAHAALVIAVIALAVTLGFTPVERLPFSSPVAIAHALIGALMISELVRHAAEAWRYRRERL
ncbi:MAG TPA: hypothetical protein VD886_08070 [Herpetosiphonaceae bacterium]|nr:hypothetical protein [Herpetosiphonaceae bacterium]